MKRIKRIFALLLAMISLVSFAPITVLAEDTEETTTVISAFGELTEQIRQQSVPYGQASSELNLPESLKAVNSANESVTVAGVTWVSSPDYDGNVAGSYTFRAVLPAGYALAEEASLPEITVTVAEEASDENTFLLMGAEDATSVTTAQELNTVFQNGGSAVLESNIILSAPLVAASGKTITLDLNGKTIDRAMTKETASLSGNVITVNGELFIKDSQGMGKITGGIRSGYTGGGGIYINGGTVTMTGGTIGGNTAAASGGGVFVENGSLAMNGGSISGNASANGGGGVCVGAGGTFTMSTGGISGNTTAGNGGGVYANEGTFIMNGGSISGNTAEGNEASKGYGGGVSVMFGGSFFLHGGEISGNTADGYSTMFGEGGGVFINMSGNFSMDGGKINGNDAYYGGGVCLNGSKYNANPESSFTMSAGEISENTTDSSSEYGNGGGVYVAANGHLSISGSRIIRNSAGSGGGVYMLNGTCTMENSEISENRTFDTLKDLNQGGGVFIANATFTMKNGKINLNKAANGGGVYVTQGGSFIMETGQINENNTYALEYLCNGGGVYINADGTFTMKGGEIRGNATSAWNMYNHGGGVYVYGGVFKVSGSISIIDNNRSGVPNNVYLKTDTSEITIVGELTGADGDIGISTRTAPEGTTLLTVAQGVNYTIGDNDFKKFTRDAGGALSLGDNKIELPDPNTSYLTYLSYNANGGSGIHSSAAILEGMNNHLTVASGNGFSRTNCSFSGWNTHADGGGNGYQADDELILTANTVLYAQWRIDKAMLAVTAPQGGIEPSTSVTCSTSGVTSSLTWKQGESNLAGNFDYNMVYSAEITLTAGPGCKFADSPEITINGVSATVISRSEAAITASIAFDKTGPRSAPTANISQTVINVANTGSSTPLTLNVVGLVDGCNPLTWTMSKADGSNILTLPSETTGTLANGELSLGSFVVGANAVGQPPKNASVTISFSGNENDDYAGLPSSITVNFKLAAGEAPAVNLDYINEKITGVSSEMEYIIDASASAPANWTGATSVTGTDIAIGSIIPEPGNADKYIHIRFAGIDGSVPISIKIPARSVSPYSTDDWLIVETETETGYVPWDHRYRVNGGEEKIGSSEECLQIPLSPGETLTYWMPATGSSFKSAEIILTAPERLPKPNVAIDFTAQTLNTATDMQYRISAADEWTSCTENMAISALGWDGTSAVSIQIRRPYTESNYASETQTLSIPAIPPAPDIIYTSTASTITVTAETGVRYRLDSGEWKTGDSEGKVSFTGLTKNHSYTIDAQKPVTGSAFQSEMKTLNVSTQPLADGLGSVSMESWTYGGTAPNPVPVSATNGTGGVTYTYAGTTANGTAYSSSMKPTDAGSYTVTAAFAAASDYKSVISAASGFTISKKEIESQWKDIPLIYDGTPKSPSFSLIGVESGDTANISAQLSESKINAGSYSVVATLKGNRAFNYVLANPSATLVIQKAPVTFSITGDTAQYDGSSHTATVAAKANGSVFSEYNVIYKNSKGETELSPTDSGCYSIYALITDTNYRHADATNGAAKKIGVLTIYTASSPKTYTVSFSGGDGAAGSVAPLKAAQAGTVRILPECTGMTNGTKPFAGWAYDGKVYQPGEGLTQPTSNITLTAVWAKDSYSVSGVVYQAGKPLPDTVVTLMRGCIQTAQTVAGAGGEYSFADTPPGRYNLVASKKGITQTVLVEIVHSGVTNQNITLPSGKTNSVLEVAAGSPALVVGNLEKTFSDEDNQAANDGSTVEIKLNAKAVDSTGPDQAAIEGKTDGTVGLYLELNLTKTVTPISGAPSTTNLTQSGVLLDIVIQIPGELQGKENYVVYRCHEGEINTLTTEPSKNGEYITVNSDKTAITIHAKLFSTYAVGYTVPATPVSGGNRSSSADYIITATAGDGGSISPSGSIWLAAGGSKTFTVAAKTGYAISDVLVDGKSFGAVNSYRFTNVKASHTIQAVFIKAAGLPYYLDEGGGKVFIGFAEDKSGKMKYIAPEGKAVLFTPNPKSFTDISGHWGKSYIDFVTEREIFVGAGNTVFLPDSGMSRAMFATIIGRLYEHSYGKIEASGSNTFDDCKNGMYYGKYVDWAVKEGIMHGYGNGRFGPDDQITREQMAVILYRFADYLGVLPGDMDATLKYLDAASISNWAERATLYCQSTGIISGHGNGMFAPRETATRAETATMIERFIESVMTLK